MKLSKKERKRLMDEIQQGFTQTWLSQDHARKEKRSQRQELESGVPHWFAFWKRPARALKPVPPIIVAKAAGSDK
jgi:hypothetical protein